MSTDTPVHELYLLDLYHKLIKQGYHPQIATLVHAIVSMLPETWPISVLHKELKRNILDISDLSKRLESQ